MAVWLFLPLYVLSLASDRSQEAQAEKALKLPNGEPVVCAYYFTHWWEPWKSDYEAIRADLRRMRSMGINTLLLDHEWSQALPGPWELIDRANRLAKECGMHVMPWLSLKTWSDILPGERQRLARQWYGVEIPYGRMQDGSPGAPLIFHPAVITMGARYTLDYLDRYLRQGPLLRVLWNGKPRPVISLSVESAWVGGFDDHSAERFCGWLRRKYRTIAKLNRAWGTNLGSFDEIRPTDTRLFDYAAHYTDGAAHPRAVEDHVAFRSETIRDSLRRMAREVRRKVPEVLLLAEYPYPFASAHPHARRYRVEYGANPNSCDWADIVLLRCIGPLNPQEVAAIRAHGRRTRQKFILTYRTFADWDIPQGTEAFTRAVEAYATQAARYASGFGFYSMNEMVDTHVLYSTAMPASEQPGWSPEKAERALRLMEAMVQRYRRLAR